MRSFSPPSGNESNSDLSKYTSPDYHLEWITNIMTNVSAVAPIAAKRSETRLAYGWFNNYQGIFGTN